MEFDRVGFDREVGLRMQRARKARGITQEHLAQRIGMPRPSYANIESGRQRIPIDVVWRVAVVLGVGIDKLVPEPLNKRSGLASVVPIRAGAAAAAIPSQEFSLAAPSEPFAHTTSVGAFTHVTPLKAVVSRDDEGK